MISDEDYRFIADFTAADGDGRDALLRMQRTQSAKTFLSLLEHISKDQTLHYILTLLDDTLQEDKSRVEIYRDYAKRKRENVWLPFLNLLNRPDGVTKHMAARITAKLACWSREPMDGTDLTFYLAWLKDQLLVTGNEYIQTVARCLQMMLRIEKYRLAFAEMGGVATLAQVLSGRVNFQIQYQLTFCLWVMTFSPQLVEQMNK